MIENFRKAMRKAGLDYAGPIVADGDLHRIKTETDKARAETAKPTFRNGRGA